MYKLEHIEYALVAIVIALQLWAFLRTWKRITVFRNIIPENVKLAQVKQPYITYPEINNDPNKHRVTMVNTLNNYLESNQGFPPNFNLVKDIVERNSQVLEEEISHNTSLPLYLGLMGTMVGIVFGLWTMSDISAAINTTAAGDKMGSSINVLLGGVKIAMVASFTGILFTVLNSGVLFNKARNQTENRKNRLYTFLQTELLPVMGRDTQGAMQELQNSMLLFSRNFNENLLRLEGLLNKNHDALIAQESILNTLENIDITSFAKGNIKMMQELRLGMQQLQQFNQYLDKLNEFTGSAHKFSEAINGVLNRTGNIEEVLQNIDAHFSMSADLLNFLKSHFAQLEARGLLIQNAIVKIDTVLDDGLNELKDHIQAKLRAIKDITIAETDQFSKMLEQSRGGLGKLELLETINNTTKLFLNQAKDFSTAAEIQINTISANTSNILNEVKQKKNKMNRLNRFWKKITSRQQ